MSTGSAGMAPQGKGLRIGVLGPLSVTRDGAVIHMPRARSGTLLAVLAMSARQPVSVDRLAELIWSDDLPKGVRPAVHNLVARVRGLVEGVVVTAADGYLLDIDPDRVDLLRFRGLVRAADGAADPGTAAELLDQALGLWRGEPVSDLPSSALRRNMVPGVVEERLRAIQRRAELGLAAGRNDPAVAEMRTLIGQYPLREPLWSLLIRALAASGRPAEAIQQYHQAREVLAEELGVDPSAELQDLYRELLRADRRGAAPAEPAASAAVPDGHQQNGATPRVPRQARAGQTVSALRQLPADTHAFTGRQAPTHPHATLGRVLEHLGTTFLDIAAGKPDPAVEVGGVVIYDPLDEPPLPGHALMLGVGVRDSGQVARLVTDLGAHGGVGLIVRAPVSADETVQAAVASTGTVLFSLTRGASWSQLAALLRSLLADGDLKGTEDETIGGIPAGDLFALANAIAALVDAPVTIEDRNSRVLAFSGQQEEADRCREETILGRQVPERYTRALDEQRFFDSLYRGEGSVTFDPRPAGIPELELPRVAIAVRAGDEILGSIWAATKSIWSADKELALTEVAKLTALHMLRVRAGTDVERRLRSDLVATALEGGPRAAEAVTRLGLAGRAALVLALGLPDDGSGGSASLARLENERRRLTDALGLHLSAVQGGAAVAQLGGVAYGIVPVLAGRDDADKQVADIARDFLKRTGSRVPALVGLGRVVSDAAGLTRSRADADRALRVLRSWGSSPRVARATDVHTESLLLELRDLAGAEEAPMTTGPIARLLDYDCAHGGVLIPTLQAWLDAFGDVIAAAAAVRVHPNTFRYRLRRITEVSGFDPGDPDARFTAMLQLRLLRQSPAGRQICSRS